MQSLAASTGEFYAPMLATAGTVMPDGPGWAFEPKYDGIRVVAFATMRGARLQSRNGIDKAAQFPEIADALTRFALKRRSSFVFDGELVARQGDGLGRFESLQSRIHTVDPLAIAQGVTSQPVVLVIFDVLLIDVRSFVDEPWTVRRDALVALQGELPSESLRVGEATIGGGAALLRRAARSGWEGVIAKRTNATYERGLRSRSWLKLKSGGQQEFVVGGYTDPRNSRPRFGALLLGVYEGSALRYAGHVGSGFSHLALEEIFHQLAPLTQKASPFVDAPKTNAPAHWVKPSLVVEVRFNEWTSAGRLRQPVFLGLRTDKNARDIRREALMAKTTRKRLALDATPASIDPEGASTQTRSASVKPTAARGAPDRDTARLNAQLSELETRGADGVVMVDGLPLSVSHLSKVYLPKTGTTKGDLMRYYATVSPHLMPHLKGRPLVLRRYPGGAGKPAFFQQNAPDDLPTGVEQGIVEHDDRAPDHRIIGGHRITALYCTQLGCIDVNPWHSRVDSLDMADYSVIDLDPGPRATFRRVVNVARWTRDVLAEIGVHAALKTSGARGLHLYIPLPRNTTYTASLLLAQIVATRVARRYPKDATVIRSVKARPTGAVYMDYLQNVQGKSVASVFSVRAHASASVSTPLEWTELDAALAPADFTMQRVIDESVERARLWTDALKHPVRRATLLARLEEATQAPA